MCISFGLTAVSSWRSLYFLAVMGMSSVYLCANSMVLGLMRCDNGTNWASKSTWYSIILVEYLNDLNLFTVSSHAFFPGRIDDITTIEARHEVTIWQMLNIIRYMIQPDHLHHYNIISRWKHWTKALTLNIAIHGVALHLRVTSASPVPHRPQTSGW